MYSPDTTRPIETKLDSNVSRYILHRTDVGIDFFPSENMAAVTKNRTHGLDSSFSHIYTKRWVKLTPTSG